MSHSFFGGQRVSCHSIRAASTLWTLAVVCLVSLAAKAAPSTAAERYVVELRVIEGKKGEGGIDPKLGALARDLRSLPFQSFQLKDAHTATLVDGERVSLEIPSTALSRKVDKKGHRFLVVGAQGRQPSGKLRFSLGIEALRFETLVAVPEGGTIIVGGPRGDEGRAVLFAVTARTQR
jgi:hypothetical protein